MTGGCLHRRIRTNSPLRVERPRREESALEGISIPRSFSFSSGLGSLNEGGALSGV